MKLFVLSMDFALKVKLYFIYELRKSDKIMS